MKRTIFIMCAALPVMLMAQQLDGKSILEKIDRNMYSKTKIITATMTIQGQRAVRTMEQKIWVEGESKSFTEMLAPAREKGTKMLKLTDQLWLYTPSTDRTIQISGHMLRQSMMGSDLSYEDMMDDSKLFDKYDAVLTGEETIAERPCYVVTLTAKKPDVNYFTQKVWVDKTRFVPLKIEMYAKTGKLLKQILFSDVVQIGVRWYPKTMEYKDMLKDGKGTTFTITSIEFDAKIPDYIFTKASLKK